MRDLKPCPFCGNRGITAQSPILERSWRVSCSSCLAASPPHCSEEDAIEKWNERIPFDIERAARFVEQRLHEYVSEHGATDPDTGTVEYPGNGEEYVYELEEIAEGIRALAAPTGTKGSDHE